MQAYEKPMDAIPSAGEIEIKLLLLKKGTLECITIMNLKKQTNISKTV